MMKCEQQQMTALLSELNINRQGGKRVSRALMKYVSHHNHSVLERSVCHVSAAK